jgi:putative transposase
MPRIFIPGVSVHIIRRGNNRGAIFTDNFDRELFLVLLETAAKRHRVEVHGYVLMTNHYHLIVTAGDADGLRLMMRDLGREYVLRYNRRHGRIGTLWTGRYRAIPIQDERYWLTCLRYVEQNPVRAGLAATPGDYPWSSFRYHAFGEPHRWLTPHPVYLALGATDAERQAAYRAICEENLADADIVRHRLQLEPRASATQPDQPNSPQADL